MSRNSAQSLLETAMSIWSRIGEFVTRVSGQALSSALEALRTYFEGDPQLRRRVAFSVAMIALSAKMAKADGVVTDEEEMAFYQIFAVPPEEQRNVARLYTLAKADIAGFEFYARRIASLCSDEDPECFILEDVLDGLFHIAKADGLIHEREIAFLQRVAEIFRIDALQFDTILSRHVPIEGEQPYRVLGLERGVSFPQVRQRYRQLVAENHPDKLIARGVPEEFLAIANGRLAAINAAYEAIERSRERA